jgi:hypothetical protein
MTTTIDTTTTLATPPAYRAAGFRDVLRSEWTKARTVPSTIWTLVATAILGIGLGALIAAIAAHHYATMSATNKALWDPTSISDTGFTLAQLAIGVLGVLLITSEYSTRGIGTSLAAVPRRSRFLAAKAIVVATMVLIAGEVMAFAAFFVGQVLISGHAPTASLGDPNVLRAVIGGGLYLTLIGLLGLAVGAILRHAAGAIAVMVALLFVLPGVAAALPASIEHTFQEYWPTQAGTQVATVVPTAHTLSAWAGLGEMCLFVAILLSAAFFVLNRRDA